VEQVDTYKISLDKIYDYFGYKEKCYVFPIDDCRDYYWDIEKHKVVFCKDKKNMILDEQNNKWTHPDDCDDDFYSHEHFYVHEDEKRKNVYEGLNFTMIVVDTRTDGNKFLCIFDNSKRMKK